MSLQWEFETNVRNHRKAAGLTQDALAERFDVTVETIGKIERGVAAPTFATAGKIATALDLPASALFGLQTEVWLESGRGLILGRINQSLSTLNDDQLSRVAKMIDAFKGS